MTNLHKKLDLLLEECSTPNWAGYSSNPIPAGTIQNARDFISKIPDSVEEPDISATTAGDITFRWYYSEDNSDYFCIEDTDTITVVSSRPFGTFSARLKLKHCLFNLPRKKNNRLSL